MLKKIIIFLTNTKEISENHKHRYENFLKLYFELLKIKSGQSKEKPAYVRSKIEKETLIVNKEWLTEKSKELK